MYKLISLSGDNIRLAPEDVAEMVTRSCRRSASYIEGVAVRQDQVILIAGDAPDDAERVYRFTLLGSDVSEADLTAELRSRYDNNFRTVGGFQLADGYWTLTEKVLD